VEKKMPGNSNGAAHHILMASMPLAGHISPHLEVIRALVNRGYRVTYLMGKRYRDVIESTGAEFFPYESSIDQEFDTHVKNIDQALIMKLITRDVVSMLPAAKAFIDAERPDLVLHDLRAPAAGAYAQSVGIPTIVLFSNFALLEGSPKEIDDYPHKFAPDDPQAIDMRKVQSELLALLPTYGIQHPAGKMRFTAKPQQALVFIPEMLQPHADKFDRNIYHFVGPVVRGDLVEEDEINRWEAPGGKRVLLVSFGSLITYNIPFYRACIEAFGGLEDWHVVLQIGSTDPAELGQIPDNFEVHSWVPQVTMLKRAAAFITHGGTGGVREALCFGVPMIIVPQMSESFENAETLVREGLSVRIDARDVTPNDLRDALSAVQNPKVKQRYDQIAREIAKQDGIELSLAVIRSAIEKNRSLVSVRTGTS
jgi:MGT family glycosyltransferase